MLDDETAPADDVYDISPESEKDDDFEYIGKTDVLYVNLIKTVT